MKTGIAKSYFKAFALLSLALPSLASAAVKIVNVDSCLNMRTGSSVRTRAVDCIDGGTVVETTGRRRGNWIQVIRDGEKGWISASYARRTSARVTSSASLSHSESATATRPASAPATKTASAPLEQTTTTRLAMVKSDTSGKYQDRILPAPAKTEIEAPARTGTIAPVKPRRSTPYVDSGKLTGTALKRDRIAASGKCMLDVVRTPAHVREVLFDYNVIPAANAKDSEKLAIAKVLFQMTALNGKVFKPVTNKKITFDSRDGVSRQKGWGLKMARGKHNCNSAHFGHEFGHTVGNSVLPGEGAYYEAFARYMGKSRCYTTGYSDDSPNENFAEHFGTFLARPELLSQGSKACQKAYAFFAEKVFPAAGHLSSCDPHKQEMLMASLEQRNASTTHGIVVNTRESSGSYKSAEVRLPANQSSSAR